jgi:hypothetical protein
MRTLLATAVVVTVTAFDLAHAQVGTEGSRLFCEKVAKVRSGDGGRIEKGTFTVSLFTNELTCIVKTPPKTYCNFTTYAGDGSHADDRRSGHADGYQSVHLLRDEVSEGRRRQPGDEGRLRSERPAVGYEVAEHVLHADRPGLSYSAPAPGLDPRARFGQILEASVHFAVGRPFPAQTKQFIRSLRRAYGVSRRGTRPFTELDYERVVNMAARPPERDLIRENTKADRG